MVINVKMPTTIVGILTFISMINSTFESLKTRKVVFILKFVTRINSMLSKLSMRMSIISWPD